MIRAVSAVLILAALLVVTPGRAPGQEAGPGLPGAAILLDVEGAIGPVTTEYIRKGLAAARKRNATLVIVRIDTPGGLADAMREIIRDFLASPIPIITFVAPNGARAASAGTYMLYASHLAAMAPGTNLGAATPVRIGGGASPADDPSDEEDADQPPDPMAAKAVNDSVAYIRALAELHGRNADWAEAAVRKAASLPAREALDLGVIEIVAPDIPGLLSAADGRTVSLQGRKVTLRTAGLEVIEMPPDWRLRLLGVLSNPNLAYILLLIGVYGIIFELASPGAILPGVIGGISLITALFALNMLPLNLAGMGLLLLGIALMTTEAFAPSFGLLGIGGAIAFALGSLFMFEEAPGFELAPGVVAAATVASAALLALALAAAVRAHRRRAPVASAMVGATGAVVSWSGQSGIVWVHGERWKARAESGQFIAGIRIRVIGREGLTLVVEADASAAQ